jgi:hypothetical protein
MYRLGSEYRTFAACWFQLFSATYIGHILKFDSIVQSHDFIEIHMFIIN